MSAFEVGSACSPMVYHPNDARLASSKLTGGKWMQYYRLLTVLTAEDSTLLAEQESITSVLQAVAEGLQVARLQSAMADADKATEKWRIGFNQ